MAASLYPEMGIHCFLNRQSSTAPVQKSFIQSFDVNEPIYFQVHDVVVYVADVVDNLHKKSIGLDL